MANPTLLDMPIARDGNKNTIPTTDNGTTGLLSQQYGWQLINAIPPQQGGKAVKREDFNGALYLLSNLLFYLQKGWQFEWDPNQAYYAGCIVKDTSNGKMYMCLNDITSTTAPHADTTNWKLWDLSMLANYLPLSGGAMTGNICRSGNISAMSMSGGESQAGYFTAYGRDTDSNGGRVIMGARNATYERQLIAFPTGELTWGLAGQAPNDLAGNAIKSKSIGAALGYKITADGLHIEYGRQAITAGVATNITFGVSYNGGYVASVTPSSGTASVGHTDLTKMTISTSNTVYVDWIVIGQ